MTSPAFFNSMRYAIATVWLVTGYIVLWIYPLEDSVALMNRVGISGDWTRIAVYAGAVLDLLMGFCTLFFPRKKLWAFQFMITLAYSLCIAIFLPEFLVHPFGPILKNVPFLTMIWLLYRHAE